MDHRFKATAVNHISCINLTAQPYVRQSNWSVQMTHKVHLVGSSPIGCSKKNPKKRREKKSRMLSLSNLLGCGLVEFVASVGFVVNVVFVANVAFVANIDGSPQVDMPQQL